MHRSYGLTFRHAGWFECNCCGWRGNSDLNGALNIGKKYLLTEVFRPGIESLALFWRRDMWWKWEGHYRQRVQKGKTRGKTIPPKNVVYPKWTWKALSKMPKWKGRYLLWARYPTGHLPREWSWIVTDVPPPVGRFA